MFNSKHLVKEQIGEEMSLIIEETTELSLVTFDEYKTLESDENTYYFFGGKDNKLMEIEVVVKSIEWIVSLREYKSILPFHKYVSLSFN